MPRCLSPSRTKSPEATFYILQVSGFRGQRFLLYLCLREWHIGLDADLPQGLEVERCVQECEPEPHSCFPKSKGAVLISMLRTLLRMIRNLRILRFLKMTSRPLCHLFRLFSQCGLLVNANLGRATRRASVRISMWCVLKAKAQDQCRNC